MDCLVAWLVVRPDLGAVLRPAAVVRDRQKRIVADGRPHQPAGRVGEPATGFQAAVGADVDAEAQPAVPGQILELDRAHERRRVESGLRVDRYVLDAVGEVVAVELAPRADSR